jgi:hypothetical protein
MKCGDLATKLYDAASQKSMIFAVTVMTTSDLITHASSYLKATIFS